MASGARPLTVSADCVSVGWICATPLEQGAACNHFDAHLTLSRLHVDDAPFMLDVGLVCGHVVAVVCVVSSEDPLLAAPRAASWLNSTFPNIRLRLSVGIAAASPTFEKDLRLGDVVVSASTERHRCGVLTYDAGARSDSPVRVTRHFDKPPDNLFRAVMRVHEERKHLNYAKSLARFLNDAASKLQAPYGQRPPAHSDKLHCPRYPHSSSTSTCHHCDPRDGIVRDRPARNDSMPRVFQGLIATHCDSVKSARRRESIVRGVHRESGLKIVCLDKTAYPLLSHFGCLVIRGIADYADAYGAHTWEDWAALAAAAYAKELLASMPPHEHEYEPEQGRRSDASPLDNVPSASMPEYPHGANMPASQNLEPARPRAGMTPQRRDPSTSPAVTCADCGNRYQRSALIRQDPHACFCWKCDMSRTQAGVGVARRVSKLASSTQDASSTVSAMTSLTGSWTGTPRRGRSRQHSPAATTEPSGISPYSSHGSEKVGNGSGSSKLRQVARMDDEAFRFMGPPGLGDPNERPAQLDLEAVPSHVANARGGATDTTPVRVRVNTPDRSRNIYSEPQDDRSKAWFPGYKPGLSVREFHHMMRPQFIFPEDSDPEPTTRPPRRLFNRPTARPAPEEARRLLQQNTPEKPTAKPKLSAAERQNSFAEIAMRGVDKHARLSMGPSPRPPVVAPPNRLRGARDDSGASEASRARETSRAREASRARRTGREGSRAQRGAAAPGPRDLVLRGRGAAERRAGGFGDEGRRSGRDSDARQRSGRYGDEGRRAGGFGDARQRSGGDSEGRRRTERRYRPLSDERRAGA